MGVTRVVMELDFETYGSDFGAIIKDAASQALTGYLSDNLEFYGKSEYAWEYLSSTVHNIISAGGKYTRSLEEIQSDYDAEYRGNLETYLGKYRETVRGLKQWSAAHPESVDALQRAYGDILDRMGV